MPAESFTTTNDTALPLLLDTAGVAHALSIGERTLWRWVSTGTFPPPDMAMGAKVRRWRRETVTAWIAARCEGGSR